MRKEKWLVAEQNTEVIARLSAQLGISRLAAAVLAARGIDTAEAAEAFLDENCAHIHDPYLMADMDKAVAILEDAIRKGERIAVYGDYDVDGVTATCVLIKYLRSRGADCRYYIPDRINEGYGLNEAAITTLKDDGCTLLVTVDSGITAVEETIHAKKLGIRVIITDHHECKDQLPPADAVVNPRRPDSDHPFRELAGVGVAFKLVCAMEKQTPVCELLAQYSDIVALGTIADVMPVLGENRIIISDGLKRMKQTDNVGLRTLIQKLGLDAKPLTANSVSFVLAPRINAAGRLGEADCTARLMLTDSCREAGDLAEHLCELNRRRQEEENAIYCEITDDIDRDPSLASGKVMLLWGEDWHTGVIGIVASRLADRYGLPCILVSSGCGKGSGRSIKGFNLYCALSACSDLLERFGGHELAVGLSVDKENLPLLKQRLEEYAEAHWREEDLKPCLDVDCAVTPEDLELEQVRSLSVLEPFGMGNPMPLFLLRDAVIQEITPISHERHVKLLLEKDGVRLCGFVFGMGSRCCPFVVGDQVDLVFSAEVNVFRGRESVQLVIKDLHWSGRSESCDNSSQQIYERFTAGEALCREEALSLCPCRDDLVAVFRHIKSNEENFSLCGMPRTLYRKIKYESKCCMNQGRFLICMDIMREFDIFDYERIGENILIRDLQYKGKVDINGSRIIRTLMEVIKG
ncbi:MAG: single-stranded-DNA-specific exonuclease RecJ [Ruminococcaceae bacterium]|jgi:single-stranded-DNA-specific exonuclease|nr:single-stranded-DNA-specific exonuclease RecJ [Oscillospiraceae bacterium]